MERFATQTPVSSRRNQRRVTGFFSALALAACFHAHAASIPVPNGDFSDGANHGTIGGGAIGGSGTRSIGAGPWNGTYFGALGLLAPPSLTIGSGKATINGLLGVSALGVVNNGGSFHQSTSAPWQAHKRYTLAADVTVGSVLDLNVLRSGNAGLALARGGSRLASTIDSTSVTVSLLHGSTYRVELVHETGASVSGDIGIHLFSEPSGVLTANLLSTVDYDNVTLATRLLDQVPTSVVAVDATPRTAMVGTTVTPPLSIRVLDADGDPISGVSVGFTVPPSGPGATVAPNPAFTDINGTAQPAVTANTIAGSYVILAEVSGISTPVTFQMTNLPGPASAVRGASGNAQSATVATPFTIPLVVEVSDAYGNAVPDVAVAFTAPPSGASATVPPTPVATDAEGKARVTPVANTVAGSYQVRATVAGVPASASFDLVNTAGPASAVSGASGNGQSAPVATPFPAPLVVQVSDAYGNAVADVPVVFTAPATGAGATLPAEPVATDADGRAGIVPIANTIAGAYEVKAAVAGVAIPATFSLTNQAGPVASTEVVGTSRQSTVVLTDFPEPLAVRVRDAHGNPIGGLAVTFVPPASGASASVANTVKTDADGYASSSATANDVAGAYVVQARAADAAPASFSLTNLLDPDVEPIDVGDPGQSGEINRVFSCVLLIQVTRGDVPQEGLEVEFSAPATGPSAILSDGIDSGIDLLTRTDEEGYAWVEATANEIAGSYVVRAQLLYSLAAPIEFTLHNLDANEPVFSNGFDGLCIPPGGTPDLHAGPDTH